MATLMQAGAMHAVDIERLVQQHNAPPDAVDGAPDLKSVLSTAELSRRPSRSTDYAAENRALIALAQELATSPHDILRKLAETALAMCHAHSAGISILNDDKASFHWPAIVGKWASHQGGGTPRDYGPCGTVLDRNVALLFSHPERDFSYFAPVTPLIEEALLVPFYVDGKAVGTVWVIAHDHSRRFDAEDLRVMTSLGTFAAAAHQTLLFLNAAQKSEEQISILAREAEHRTKNVLATVQAAVHLSHSDTSEGLKHAISGRIQALANVHTLFVQSRWTGAELHSLVSQELLPYSQNGETRARIDGPNLMLEPNSAQTIAVTLHELATNAAKYGALSRPDGHIQVEWSRPSDGRLVLRWTETGGPLVKPPTHEGFGTRVMDGMIRGQLKGKICFDWRAEGLACEIVMPANRDSH
jgi:two-component sensor histidine kinase